jgi:integrase
MQGKITKSTVEKLKGVAILHDTEIKGFVARRLESGAITYGYRYRAAGKQRWLGLGLHGSVTADEARIIAKKRAGEVAHSRDPVAEREEKRVAAVKAKAAEKNTVGAVLDAFMKRYVRTEKSLRSADAIEDAFARLVKPRIGDISIYSVRRSHVVNMLDEIADENGPRMADLALAYIRKGFNWYSTRDDEFSSPVIRGMSRTTPKERARKRILADDEIRDLWRALETADVPACYRPFVKSLLLCATRRNESADMHASEINGDAWTIPGQRYKNKLDHVIPLTPAMRELIGEKPEGFVFSTTGGKKPFSGQSKSKNALDTEIAKIRKAEGRGKMAPWTLHDLRRTARSLMSRAGVPTDHGERCLGHVIPGVRGVYDRHEYLDEKRAAFEALAGQVDRILNPPADNVIPFAGVAK